MWVAALEDTAKREPQNIEQGLSNFEVKSFTSAVQNSLFDIRNFLDFLLKSALISCFNELSHHKPYLCDLRRDLAAVQVNKAEAKDRLKAVAVPSA